MSKQKISKGEQRFNELKDAYIKDFKRTSGKKLKDLFYKDGYVYLQHPSGSISKYKISQFEKMCVTLASRESIVKQKPKLVAKLVTFSLMTRVIVRDNADDDEIAEAAKQGILNKVNHNELVENIEDVKDDTEMPYDPKTDGVTLMFPVN